MNIEKMERSYKHSQFKKRNPFATDAEFNESDHPRADNGQFGSGGGGKADAPSAGKEHPFVGNFMKEHSSTAKQKAYLENVPKEKLHTALKLAKSSESENSKKVAKMIEKELDERAMSGK